MHAIEPTENGWHLPAGELELDCHTGCLARLRIERATRHLWTAQPGDVNMRDVRLESAFSRRHPQRVDCVPGADELRIRNEFVGAPWVLEEVHLADPVS